MTEMQRNELSRLRAKASQANTRPGDLVPMLEAAARDLRAMGCILAAELVQDALGEIESGGGDLCDM